MMRRIVASLLPLFVAVPLLGQALVEVRAGLNRSTSTEGPRHQDAREGLVLGVDATLPLANAIELRAGGAYAQKGFSVRSEGVELYSRAMDYFQLSALARVGTSRDGRLSVGVLLGPWTAFHVSCNTSVHPDSFEFGLIVEGGCSDLAPMDFGIAVGGGVELAVSEGLRLGLDLLYWYGIANVGGRRTAGNRSLAAQAGVVIPCGG